jgi:hypothetical protein
METSSLEDPLFLMAPAPAVVLEGSSRKLPTEAVLISRQKEEDEKKRRKREGAQARICAGFRLRVRFV